MLTYMDEVVQFVCFSALATINNPIELVKCRFQTMNELVAKGTIHSRYHSILECIREIKIREGFKGYWKGNSIGVARFFPSEVLNNQAKNCILKMLPSSALSNTAAGVMGGWIAKLILYPFDTVRIFISTST